MSHLKVLNYSVKTILPKINKTFISLKDLMCTFFFLFSLGEEEFFSLPPGAKLRREVSRTGL